MDKYQEFILRQVYRWDNAYLLNGFTSDMSGRQNCGAFDFKRGVITINQDDDIFSTVYRYAIPKRYREKISKAKISRTDHYRDFESWNTDYLSGVEITRDGVNWENLIVLDRDSLSPYYYMVLDFNDRIKKVKFAFVNGLADDYIMDVVYVEADKEEYHRKKAEEEERAHIAALTKKANIRVSTGESLVNIYFAPCCDNYVGTEIELYSEGNLMAKYKVPEEQFFKSIEGLAYGRYSFILKQYGKDGKLIFQTDETPFGIRKPHHGYDADI